MKVIGSLRRSLLCCFSTTSTTTSPSSIKNRLSASLTDLFKDHQEPPPHLHPQDQELEQEDSLIDAATTATQHPNSPSRSLIFGTIFGRRRGHVSFCVQSDPSNPPPFLFELSIPTHLLAKEMSSGLLRIALECHRTPGHVSSSNSSSATDRRVWKAYCNGRKVGYAVRRKLTERDRVILKTVRSMSGGAGELVLAGDARKEGELMYMRACYERVVGSRDSVSYHLVNPGGSPSQELSVFLLRTG